MEKNMHIAEFKNSLSLARDIENIADRIFNYSGISDHDCTNAAIYLSKGAAELKNQAYIYAKTFGVTSAPIVKKKILERNARLRSGRRNILGLLVTIVVTTIVFVSFSCLISTSSATDKPSVPIKNILYGRK